VAGLSVRDAVKTFGTFRALDRVSLEVRDGEFLAVLGPSGCGKTTLLRLVAGFDQLDGGAVAIGGRVVSDAGTHVPPEERRVGIVFQSYALWPHMSVDENVGYPLRVARVPRAERRRRVADALALVGLSGYGERRPAQLSGGQRQRVALARCLIMAPSLVLLDEPLANLDVHLRAAMEDEFADFHRRTGTTMIYITHDQAEAMALADRIAVMDQGRLMQLASPSELFREPATEMVARFIGEGVVMPAELREAAGGRCTARVLGLDVPMRCRPDQRPTAAAKACLRTRELRFVAEDAPGIPAAVRRITYQGGFFRIEVAPEADPTLLLTLQAPEPFARQPGEAVRIGVEGGWIIPEP
jgi:iron(III) transport system ATP-binding protein